HREVRVMGDFLNQETTRLQEELAHTEQQLIDAKKAAGVVSVDDAKKGYTEQIAKIRMDLYSAQEELAGHQALLEQSTNNMALKVDATNTNGPVQIPSEQVDEYNRLISLLKSYNKRDEELRFSFTTNSPLVKEIRAQILEIEKQKQKIEQSYPQ